MNNEEPIRSANENQVISTQDTDLPEQAKQPFTSMPRTISILNLINQWQPMGFRIVLNLPYVGDDQNFIFAIRSGPFIPCRLNKGHHDMTYQQGQALFTGEVVSFAYNNMVPIILPSDKGSAYPSPSKPIVTLTNYDLPPVISTIAQSFRRWRGDMQYRIRVSSGFTTQGYLITTPLKNVMSPIGIYDQYKYAPVLNRQDTSFREPMLNSYGLSDTSMYRHTEVTMMYDYPTSYYDQFAWIAARCVPGNQFLPNGTGALRNGMVTQNTPYGDNWICVGVRGDIASSQVGSQMSFDIEYRCVEGFQFADPFIPPAHTATPFSSITQKLWRVPDSTMTSDGIHAPKAATPVVTLPPLKAAAVVDIPAARVQTRVANPTNQRSRNPRDVDEVDAEQSIEHAPEHIKAYMAGLSSLEKLQLAAREVMGTSSRQE